MRDPRPLVRVFNISAAVSISSCPVRNTNMSPGTEFEEDERRGRQSEKEGEQRGRQSEKKGGRGGMGRGEGGSGVKKREEKGGEKEEGEGKRAKRMERG